MKSIPTIAVVTGIWKRPEIFKMFAEGVRWLQVHFDGRMRIIACVAGSEGETSKQMVERYHDFYYVETPNDPLGEKMNKACFLARDMKVDYCLMMGSDDIIGINLLAYYYGLMLEGIDYIYMTDCYFFDTKTKHGLYWGGYIQEFNKGNAAGIGRMISKKALDAIDWICWPPGPGHDKQLDTGFDDQIKKAGCSRWGVNIKEIKCFALDIKSSTNMTPFTQWNNSFYTDGKALLLNNMPVELADLVYGEKIKL